MKGWSWWYISGERQRLLPGSITCCQTVAIHHTLFISFKFRFKDLSMFWECCNKKKKTKKYIIAKSMSVCFSVYLYLVWLNLYVFLKYINTHNKNFKLIVIRKTSILNIKIVFKFQTQDDIVLLRFFFL
jgi:hypothetical protein